MENKPVKTYQKGDLTLKIYQDTDAQDPREADHLGVMVCFHRNYQLGDKTELKAANFEGWASLGKYIKEELGGICIIPLYLLDHSGITIRAGRDFSDCDPGAWDSGQVGFIYTTRARCKEMELKADYPISEIEKQLRGEVEIYDQYLTGDVYGFRIEKPKKCDSCGHVEYEHIDSCWGFYGFEPKDNGMLDHSGPEWEAAIYGEKAEVKKGR